MNLPNDLTIEKMKAWAKENRPLAMTVLKATAYADVERERVDAYIEPIFLRYGFTNDMDSPRNTSKGELLTKSRDIYLSEDAEGSTNFYAECDVAHRAHGFTGETGYCPALIAEDLKIKAENLLLESMAKLIGASGFYTLELRKKALDWAFGVCLVGSSKEELMKEILG